MKIMELAHALKRIYDQHGDVEVLFAGPNHDQDPYGVNEVEFQVVEDEDEYPEDFDMPVGLKFVLLGN